MRHERKRQTHVNNFTESDMKDVRLARLFFKHYESTERFPEEEVALIGLLPAMTRFKSLLQAEIPAILNPEYTPDMVITRAVNNPSIEMYNEAGQLKSAIEMAKRYIAGFEDRYAYGMIKDIWMPEPLKAQLRNEHPTCNVPGASCGETT